MLPIGCFRLVVIPRVLGEEAMRTTFPCSQARRRFRRLLSLVAMGHSFVITKNGKEMCRLTRADADDHGTIPQRDA